MAPGPHHCIWGPQILDSKPGIRGTLSHFISTNTVPLLVLAFGTLDEEKPKKTLTSKYPLFGKGRVRQEGKEGPHRKRQFKIAWRLD